MDRLHEGGLDTAGHRVLGTDRDGTQLGLGPLQQRSHPVSLLFSLGIFKVDF